MTTFQKIFKNSKIGGGMHSPSSSLFIVVFILFFSGHKDSKTTLEVKGSACPDSSWVEFENKCYLFVSDNGLSWQDADRLVHIL